MRAIDVTANAIADRTPNQHVRQEVVATGEARHTRGGCQSVSANLHETVISVFVCHDSRERPRGYRMSRRKRKSVFEGIAPLSAGTRAAPLSGMLDHKCNHATINQRFSAEQSRFASTRVVRRSAD